MEAKFISDVMKSVEKSFASGLYCAESVVLALAKVLLALQKPILRFYSIYQVFYQAVEKVFLPVILSEAKDLTPKRNKGLADSSSPSAPQNDSIAGFFNSLLIFRKVLQISQDSRFEPLKI